MDSKQFKATATIANSIFGAYDIRGIVDETLTNDIVYSIGLALGSMAAEAGEQQVIVARDGRLSSPSFAQALTAGLLATGRDVIDIGAVPTPLLYYATHVLGPTSGVMITGSHNPANYNGFKIVIAGVTLAEEKIQEVYQRICEQRFIRGQGSFKQTTIIDNYIDYVSNNIHLPRPLKIVIDCGNGIAGAVAPALYRSLGCEVIELYCEVDGRFPNHHPDPSDLKSLDELIRTVKQQKADIGLAFDGDGDRLGVVTDQGEIIFSDRQLMLFAQHLLRDHRGAKIIYEVKCTRYLQPLIREWGGEPILWKTGHSLIKSKIRETGALLAGEMSGHIFFKDRWFGFDDGLYVGARLLEILAKHQETASAIFSTFPNSINTPELKIAIPVEKKFPFMTEFAARAHFPESEKITIDGLRVEFSDGWGLVRASNTTPMLIARFEADNEAALQRIIQLFKQQLLLVDDSLELQF